MVELEEMVAARDLMAVARDRWWRRHEICEDVAAGWVSMEMMMEDDDDDGDDRGGR